MGSVFAWAKGKTGTLVQRFYIDNESQRTSPSDIVTSPNGIPFGLVAPMDASVDNWISVAYELDLPANGDQAQITLSDDLGNVLDNALVRGAAGTHVEGIVQGQLDAGRSWSLAAWIQGTGYAATVQPVRERTL